MTSHIFLGLGMWDETVTATRSLVRDRADRTKWWPRPLHVTGSATGCSSRAASPRRGGCSRPRGPTSTAGPRPAGPTSPHAGALPGEHRPLGRLDRWPGRSTWTAGLGRLVRFAEAFALASGALGRGDRRGGRRRLAELGAHAPRARPTTPTAVNDQVPPVLARELRPTCGWPTATPPARIALGARRRRREDTMPLEFGPPDMVKPPHELLGELLLDAGRPQRRSGSSPSRWPRRRGARCRCSGWPGRAAAAGDPMTGSTAEPISAGFGPGRPGSRPSPLDVSARRACLRSAAAPSAPRVPGWWAALGPGVVWMALAQGSGELIWWPYLVAKYGLTFVWLLIPACLLQYPLNVEIGRYTLLTGESIFRGLLSASAARFGIFLGS